MDDPLNAPATRAELSVVQNDLTLLRTEMRSGFEKISSEFRKINSGFEKANSRFESLHVEIRNTRRVLAMEIVKTNERIDHLSAETKNAMKSMSSAFFNRIDGFMANVGKTDRAQIIADWRMTELEKRVAAIESRPA